MRRHTGTLGNRQILPLVNGLITAAGMMQSRPALLRLQRTGRLNERASEKNGMLQKLKWGKQAQELLGRASGQRN